MTSKGNYLSWIVVSDIKKARKFFTEVLGFKELVFHEEYKWAEFEGKEGGGRVGVAQHDAHSEVKAGSNAILTFSVDDIEKSKKDLISKSVKVVGEIIEVPGHVKMQSFCDGDGNFFQIVETLE